MHCWTSFHYFVNTSLVQTSVYKAMIQAG